MVFSAPRSLDDLAIRCRTDKSSQVHNFAQFYEQHFAHLRGKEIHLLEIGVGRGSSLRMWRKYFSRGRLTVIESEPRRRWYQFLGAKLFVGRQEDRGFLQRVMQEAGPADIIIDDGSHRVDDQQITLGFLFPFLKKGGHYVIEDLHTSFWSENTPFAVLPNEKNSTCQMLVDFKKTKQFKSEYLSQEELQYLNENVESCELYSHQSPRDHLTSLLRKK